MKNRNIALILVLMVAVAIYARDSCGQVIDLNEIPVSGCYEPWEEFPPFFSLQFENTTEEDCDGGGNCSFEVEDGGVRLNSARLAAKTISSEIVFIHAGIIDHCEPGCTRLFYYSENGVLLDSDANEQVGVFEQLEIDESVLWSNPSGTTVVSSCDGYVDWIHIELWWDVVDGNSWSEVKARY